MTDLNIDNPERRSATSAGRLHRVVFVALAVLSLALGAIGVIVPGVPTTPFLLLACYFSAKSSPRIYRYIKESELFGPLVQDWQEHRGIRLRTKVHAIGFVVIGLAILVLTTSAYPVWMGCGLVLGLIGILVILQLPTI